MPVEKERLIMSARGSAMKSFIKCSIELGILFGPLALLVILQLIVSIISYLSVGHMKKVCSDILCR